MRHEGAREEADSVVRLHSLRVEQRNPANAAAWRGALEDEAGEVQGFQLANPLLCEAGHRVGVVHSGVGRDEARRMEIADQAHGLARSSQPDLHRSEEHTSELQSPYDLVCRLLLEKKKKKQNRRNAITKTSIIKHMAISYKEIKLSTHNEFETLDSKTI